MIRIIQCITPMYHSNVSLQCVTLGCPSSMWLQLYILSSLTTPLHSGNRAIYINKQYYMYNRNSTTTINKNYYLQTIKCIESCNTIVCHVDVMCVDTPASKSY